MAKTGKPIRDSGTILQRLHELGYFYSDEALKLDLVEAPDVGKLTIKDNLAKAAVREFQSWFEHDLSQQAYAAYSRPIKVDGDLGALTENELFAPRCAFPDYPHPTMGYVTKKGKLLGSANPADANHPDSCRREMTKALLSGYRLPGATFDELMTWEKIASSRWVDHFDIGIRIDNSLGRNAHRWVMAARLGGNILADQFLAQNSCNANLRGRYDSDRQWDRRLYIPTATHEEGHFWGCPHIRDDEAIMFPSIHRHSIQREGRLHASDIRLMRSLGYRQVDRPDPDPDPDPDDPRVPTVQQLTGKHLAILSEDGLSQWALYEIGERR